ncbi:MAG: L-threonylcarbamoyladenylate synthase [Chitinophagaceae bacterium]|nr:L-threonylcarbamoyladenylate synthase [Chitinophagaceae bacterium]
MITETGSDINRAASLLQQGQLVAIPTETVYGLAGNALRDDAVLSIYRAKERPHFNPLIIHLPSWEAVAPYVAGVPEAAHALARAFMPGPLTLLLPRTPLVPDLVTAGSPKVAVRVPGHPLTHRLLQALDFPLAAPSANRFGYVSPVTAAHVAEGLGGRIPYILDGGPCEVGVESTIVDFEGDAVIIRRTGKISAAQIESVCGRPVLMQTSADDHPVAPGMLKSHYATTTPLVVGSLAVLNRRYGHLNRLLIGWGSREELLAQAGADYNDGAPDVLTLSPSRSIDEVARRLFAAMRDADAAGYEVILAQRFPDAGIGQAVNDRLQRAQHAPEEPGSPEAGEVK